MSFFLFFFFFFFCKIFQGKHKNNFFPSMPLASNDVLDSGLKLGQFANTWMEVPLKTVSALSDQSSDSGDFY